MFWIGSLLCLLTSCCMYKTKFECPPGEGIPCVSVTTIEKMIIETPCGDDEFLGCVPKLVNMQRDPVCKCSANSETKEPFQRRIWIKGCCESDYYYFTETQACDNL